MFVSLGFLILILQLIQTTPKHRIGASH